jgi:EAL domain-containing protein (putative c-di-GMP-specific phosphodiesterase class I)
MPGLKEALRAVRSLGIKVAIDDFGSGYSALTYLRDLAVDAVKLDRSFCSGLAPGSAAEAIVAMTVALAHRLGFDVVAEGVEQADVYEHVGALGCDVAQGYWISRPLPEHELLAWLRRWSAERAHVATPAATPAA